jgi:hypothetical protein
MIFDDPNEITRYGRTTTMTEAFYRRIERLNSELLIEVPYLVVRKRGLEAVKRLRDRGVRIRILTNSLASNDVLAAHAAMQNIATSSSKPAWSSTSCVRTRRQEANLFSGLGGRHCIRKHGVRPQGCIHR